MAKEATKIQRGERVDYTASADIAVGQVVPLGTRVGVACTDIPNGGTGALDVVGVYEMPAVNNVAFAVGDALYWDDTANKLTKTATNNTLAGWAVAAKVDTAAVARVKIG